MSDKVLNCLLRRPQAKWKLFCFPWAGGGAVFYANWGRNMSEDVEVHGVCLAGRESRYNEPVSSDVGHVIQELVSAVKGELNGKPFAFWGHSMGAYLAFLTANHMKKELGAEPNHLFVSGTSGPFSESRRHRTEDVTNYSEDEFIQFLRRIGGTPSEILDNKEYISIFLPALKADFELLYNISAENSDPMPVLSSSIHVFDGSDDAPHDLQAWRSVSSGEFDLTILKGGHFYLKDTECSIKLQQCILQKLSLTS
ncbi:S-acyl fatty acid synthase thioesterase, medium chain-like [Mya arenaria]|uniref:S-acyl fatty acid synthase thioesterase, medium chain-like n=1 Tax=Mya arenaria TaxID=6604 RepID=UPI0022E1F501|nr:S-acyl fatty acid synthase thioesterase, medium chain-like [Mya arenaria]XP_052795164.1 S-acyl fatty acid synthase thioesterase, medium chain-like [Mya arenaria]